MTKRLAGILIFTLLLPAYAIAEEATDAAAEGTLSLATNPQVMVYIDGGRIGMSPLFNHRLEAGEHQVSLLLIQPNGQRLRANYRVVIEAERTTMASLNLVDDAPVDDEVRTLAPEPAAAVAQQAPPVEVEEAPPAEPLSVANPPRQTMPPVDVAAVVRQDPTVAIVASPQPLVDNSRPMAPIQIHGLSRELVREGMEELRPVVERCMAGAAGVVRVRVVIQPDGGVAEVEAQGVYRGTDIGQCLEDAFPEEAAFPIYSGDPVPVVYPYRVTND